MSFLDRIGEANARTSDDFLPLVVDDRRLGWLRPAFAERLAAHPGVFRVEDGAVRFAAALAAAGAAHRSAAVAEVLAELRAAGVIRGWRDELFPVSTSWSAAPAFLIERAAVPHFGAGGHGVHLNGWVRRGTQVHMWVARRARHKPTWPGLLDQIAAGGQPAGIGLRENMIKESAEEAGIPRPIAERMHAAGAVTYVLETEDGLRPDTVYVFDLELPGSFEPRNTDGEVEAFELLPIEEVAAMVRDGTGFKFNCSLVVIDFLIRHGLLDEREPDYVAIVRGLRAAGGDPAP